MAKRKNAVALFEVITATKRKETQARNARESAAEAASRPSATRTPRWWFKSKVAGQEHAADASPHYGASALPPAGDAAHSSLQPSSFQAPGHPSPLQPAAPQLSAPTDFPQAPSAASATVHRVMPAGYVATPEQVSIPGGADPFGLDVPAAPQSRPARRNWLGLGVKKLALNPDSQEVTLRFRYTTAIVAGFAICVAVGLAYISGKQSSKATAGANTVSTEQLRKGPILAGVLDVQPDRVARTGDTPDTDPPRKDAPAKAPHRPEPPEANSAPPVPTNKPAGPVSAPGGVEVGLPRTTGLNYVIIQSYGDEKTALEAQKALESASIPCTVEPAPKGWAGGSTWWSVIGTHGVPRTNSMPEYRQYVQALANVSKSFAGKSKFKAFDNPSAYKWK